MIFNRYSDIRLKLSSTSILFMVSVYLTAFLNTSFFSNVYAVYPLNDLWNLGFLISITILLTGINMVLLSMVCFGRTLKPIVIVVLVISSLAAYYMDSYNIIIDNLMIQNIINTDVDEALDLFSVKLVMYFIFLGVLPSYFVYKVEVSRNPLIFELVTRSKLILVTVAGIFLLMYAFGNYYASFIREHKLLRAYVNPGYYMYSTTRHIESYFKSDWIALTHIGHDASITEINDDRELLVFVVGETARADRFSLNGYPRNTNPFLKNENVISFTNFWSCGTSTAISVPCMFSIYKEGEYRDEKVQTTENALDVLQHAGVNVLWLDNNSNSKGVADRLPYISYRNREVNSVCDIECRDIGMLEDIQAHINKHEQGDILIVLHQMGNHGPAYYKRYPEKFQKFAPICHTNELKDCSKDEINNSYDNAILYTDYFLSKVIALLKDNDGQFEAAMLYVSDHGESLGENGVYLHGLPNFIAPDTQRHVPAILWFGENFHGIDTNRILAGKDKRYTHDNIFHTLLGFMEVNSKVYDKNMDLLHNNLY